MTKELQKIAEVKEQLKEAEEVNAVEAIAHAGAQGDAANIDISLLLGRAQMSQTFAKFADVVTLSTLKKIKETKQYRALKGKTITISDDIGEKPLILNGTWEEFCSLCNTSKSSVDERLSNLDTFGESALHSMQVLGMTTRDLRKLRKLPEEELKAIVDGSEVKVSDREEALEIIEEMAVKHRTEKAALVQTVAKLEQDSQSNERLLSSKDKKINELTKQLETKLTPAQKRQKEEEINAHLLNGLTVAEMDIDRGLARFGDAIQTIHETSNHPLDLDSACDDAAYRVLSRLVDMVIDLRMVEPAMQKLEELKTEAQRLNLV